VQEPGLFETIYNCRAIRYLRPDPVPDELIRKVLDAAIQAPSGSNRQPWHFLVVKDPAVRRALQGYYRRAFELYRGMVEGTPPRPGVEQETMERMVRSATHLAEHLHEAPVLLVPLLLHEQARVAGDGPLQDLARKSLASSIYPAVQNALLACRALGLGACLTTLHMMHEAEVAELLGLPANAETMCLIPIGWPAARFGPVKRVPVAEVASLDRFGRRL
jgi:nitroreductase